MYQLNEINYDDFTVTDPISKEELKRLSETLDTATDGQIARIVISAIHAISVASFNLLRFKFKASEQENIDENEWPTLIKAIALSLAYNDLTMKLLRIDAEDVEMTEDNILQDVSLYDRLMVYSMSLSSDYSAKVLGISLHDHDMINDDIMIGTNQYMKTVMEIIQDRMSNRDRLYMDEILKTFIRSTLVNWRFMT